MPARSLNPQRRDNSHQLLTELRSQAGKGVRHLIGLITLLTVGAIPAGAQTGTLGQADLQAIYLQAANRAAEIAPQAVIAIVDRDGRLLLISRADGGAAPTAEEKAIATSKAGTAVFLSSNKHAFTTRTAGFIIQQNFPPRVLNRPPGPLVGVGFSSLAYSDVNYFSELNGNRIPGTRIYASPGGVPLFKNGLLAAGIGVTGDGTEAEDSTITGADNDEAIALAGQIGYAPDPSIEGTGVYIDGISLPYINTPIRAASVSTAILAPIPPAPPAPKSWTIDVIGGVRGELRAPIIDDPLPGTIRGEARLTAAEVRTIISNAAARTLHTRAGIRLPPGQSAATFITVVSNPDSAGTPGTVLGTFRTPDATIFSWDVAVQKARTAIFFSNDNRAYSTRCIGFLAQSMYPPGISGTNPGPFNGLQERFSIPLITGGPGANPNLPNGITIFPGGIPLYRNGVLIGAIGVSGDGIDQDDIISASGTVGYQAGEDIRSDYTVYLGARLPYVKFPRNPDLIPSGHAIPPGFATFQALNFTLAQLNSPQVIAADADPDGDGLDTLSEYAYLTNPTVLDAAGAAPALGMDPVSGNLQITFRRNPAATDLTYIVEASGNLTTWTPIASSTGGAATTNLGGALSINETGTSPLIVTVIDGVSMAPPASRFLRLTLELQ